MLAFTRSRRLRRSTPTHFNASRPHTTAHALPVPVSRPSCQDDLPCHLLLRQAAPPPSSTSRPPVSTPRSLRARTTQTEPRRQAVFDAGRTRVQPLPARSTTLPFTDQDVPTNQGTTRHMQRSSCRLICTALTFPARFATPRLPVTPRTMTSRSRFDFPGHVPPDRSWQFD